MQSRTTGAAALLAVVEAEQDRWFLWGPVLFGLGIGLYFSLRVEPGLTMALVPLVAVLALRWALPALGLSAMLLSGLTAMAAGFAVAKARTDLVAAPTLQTRLEGVRIRGRVETLEPRPGGGGRVAIAVSSIEQLAPIDTPHRVRVRLMDSTEGATPGAAITLRATLSPPGAPIMPGGYDFARAAYFAGLGAVGFARGAIEPDTSAPPPTVTMRLRAA
ncbi:MAG TPA: DUF4131 domain-containing protein, partial [Hyphomicrobiaceae bacterium]|nr:DUF4131 domain-containing protein [Hyphomicrobiaceae bacterium]